MAKLIIMDKSNSILIDSFKKEYASDFYNLNKTWIEESWHLEESDIKDLSNPEKLSLIHI